MSKAVLISIKPKSVRLILNGKKTILESKTAPKLEMPFKVYMYCTKEGKGNDLRLHVNDMKGRKDVGVTTWWRDRKKVLTVNEHLPHYRFDSYLAEGKVVAEFTCDEIKEMKCIIDKPLRYYDIDIDWLIKKCGLTYNEIFNYGKGRTLYGWHISDLKVYDQPKELSEYKRKLRCCHYPCSKEYQGKRNACNIFNENCEEIISVDRPPQSWCYVEEI